MTPQIEVVSKGRSQLEDFLKSYWNQRLSNDPYSNYVEGKATIGENIPRTRLRINQGDEVNIAIGTSVFTEKNDRNLVRQEIDAVQPGQLSVKFNEKQLVEPDIDRYRVGPVGFSLMVAPGCELADRMEFPIQKGKDYHEAWTGGYCMVVKMNTKGLFQVRVDFDGVRGYKNRVEAEVEVI